MKRFNQLTLKQQKTALVIFCMLFAALLILSIRYQQMSINTGNIQQPRIKNK
ncbi:hypothetical protein [Mucilaginibacter sp. UR6-11]|uniref:hypothetical protein n=1 Tax=Mucilaginibacter sp. UR6-11 TaxID=1435644 RepID=UPI001E47EBAB|nr:hypothetical protein [Mucilaginibacter sp. UR6-11]MCC8423622.1 hypothetical protein [Mucilaginibacter sp. UR6-11]